MGLSALETTGYAGCGYPNVTQRSILLISGDDGPASTVEAALSGAPVPFSVFRVQALFDGLNALQGRIFDLIMSDLFLPDGQGLATLRHLQQHAPRTPVIALCHAGDRDTAVNAVRKGAHDFFCYEDFDAANLLRSVEGVFRNTPAEEDKKASERRNNARFPCRLAVSYQTLEAPVLAGQGVSETLNISSKGLLFTSDEKFQTGQLVQVSLDWPARLENQIALKLVAEGRIVRNSNGQTAMTIEKYEFRTRRTANGTVRQDKTNRPAEAAQNQNSQLGTAAGEKTNGVKERRPV